jgi:hypothetical protein
MKAIVGSDRDPLSVVVDMVLNDELDVQLRLSAAHAAHTSQAHTVREVGNSEHCPARAELIESLAGVSLVHALSL